MFTGIFIFEALLKVIAKGLFFGKNTYLKNPRNYIDIAVVITG